MQVNRTIKIAFTIDPVIIFPVFLFVITATKLEIKVTKVTLGVKTPNVKKLPCKTLKIKR